LVSKSSVDIALQDPSFKDMETVSGFELENDRKNFSSFGRTNAQDMDLEGAGNMEQLILFDKVFVALLRLPVLP
jgi:hypothetical protein